MSPRDPKYPEEIKPVFVPMSNQGIAELIAQLAAALQQFLHNELASADDVPPVNVIPNHGGAPTPEDAQLPGINLDHEDIVAPEFEVAPEADISFEAAVEDNNPPTVADEENNAPVVTDEGSNAPSVANEDYTSDVAADISDAAATKAKTVPDVAADISDAAATKAKTVPDVAADISDAAATKAKTVPDVAAEETMATSVEKNAVDEKLDKNNLKEAKEDLEQAKEKED